MRSVAAVLMLLTAARVSAQDTISADTSGTLVDGTPTNGVVELRTALLQRPDAFRTTMLENLLAFADTGSLPGSAGTPRTLVQARRILRATPAPRGSALIAAAVM